MGTTAENEAVHSQYLMMMGIMILLLVLGTTIPLSMKKKVKISMTNPLQQGKQQRQKKNAKKVSFFLTTTANIEENHAKYQMMKGILRIDSNLATIILLSMQKK